MFYVSRPKFATRLRRFTIAYCILRKLVHTLAQIRAIVCAILCSIGRFAHRGCQIWGIGQ